VDKNDQGVMDMAHQVDGAFHVEGGGVGTLMKAQDSQARVNVLLVKVL
jgi:hypothetical protein